MPYFRAGLENNELCLWITPGVLGKEDAKRALADAVPDFGDYEKRGQIEIIPSGLWDARRGKAERAILSRLERALAEGFDGLRLASNSSEKDGRTPPLSGLERPGRFYVIALHTYARDDFDALGLMDLVKNYRLALVRNGGQWEVIESSEARSVRDALRRSEEKLESLFSNMSEGFAYHRIVLDAKGRPCDYIFLEVNDAFEKLTGLKAADIIGKKVTGAIPGIEKDPTDWIGKYGSVALTGKPVQFESYSCPLKRWYSVSAFSPHRGYFAVTVNDITERKETEERIISLNEQLRSKIDELSAANNELEAFSYSVSHDLRSPLRSIDGFSQEVLEDYRDKLDENGIDSLLRIRAATQRMGRLIDGLLGLSRILRTQLKYGPVNLSAIGNDIAKLLRESDRKRSVAFVIEDGLSAEGDEALLYAALQNLFGNAWKFSENTTGARIEFGVDMSGGSPVFFVKDNGAGFDMAFAHKLFAPFQRLHDTGEFEGTGIGLATVSRIIYRHGGRIWAEGKVGEGAVFYFTLNGASLNEKSGKECKAS